MTALRPSDEKQLVAIVAAAADSGAALEVIAGGSKRDYGRPGAAEHHLDLSALSGVRLYEPEELVLTAGAATPLAAIEAALTRNGQHLAFEPPDWRHFWPSDKEATLGGTVACNLAGPRRIRDGAARDHHLGFHAVSGRGEIFKSGGRVVKNVTGYDLSKLIAGSFGTLAVVTELTVKVVPAPEETRTVILRGLSDADAQRAMSTALATPNEVSGVAHLPKGLGPGSGEAMTLLRLEGHAPSVAARSEALAAAMNPFGKSDIVPREVSLSLWQFVRDAMPLAFASESAIWRVSVAPTAGPALVASLARTLDFTHFYDWAGGMVWLAVVGADDGGAATIRAVLGGAGHATLLRGGRAMRETVPVFQPLAPAHAALAARVKASFDPKRILNPGRMYRDI